MDIQKYRDRLLGDVGIPTWFVNECPYCTINMPVQSVLGYSLELTAKVFGNVSVSYCCPHCSSLVELNYEQVAPYMTLDEFIKLDEQPSIPVNRCDIESDCTKNNVLEWKSKQES